MYLIFLMFFSHFSLSNNVSLNVYLCQSKWKLNNIVSYTSQLSRHCVIIKQHTIMYISLLHADVLIACHASSKQSTEIDSYLRSPITVHFCIKEPNFGLTYLRTTGQFVSTVPIRRNLTGNANGNRTNTERVWERDRNGYRTHIERIQNAYRTGTERIQNGNG